MKRLSLFIAVTLACTLLAGPGQQALLTVKTPAAGGSFSPSDLASLKRWIKADAIGGGLSDGDPISTAADSSGEGNTLTQSGSNRPLYQTGVANGLPAMEFTAGSTQYMVGSAISGTAKTWAIAYQPNSITGIDVSLMGTDALTDYYRYSGDGDSYAGSFRLARINSYPTAVPTSGVHVLIGVSTSSGYEIWIDGVSQGSQSASFSNGTTFTLGASTSTARPWNGYIFEYCEWNGDETASVADINTYLQAKWN